MINFDGQIVDMTIKTIDIKNSDGKQAILIPNEMRIDDNKVYLKKIGNTIFIIPFHNPWQNLIESVNSFTDDFMDDREQLEQQQRESFD
jgi:antitoxin VapB